MDLEKRLILLSSCMAALPPRASPVSTHFVMAHSIWRTTAGIRIRFSILSQKLAVKTLRFLLAGGRTVQSQTLTRSWCGGCKWLPLRVSDRRRRMRSESSGAGARCGMSVFGAHRVQSGIAMEPDDKANADPTKLPTINNQSTAATSAWQARWHNAPRCTQLCDTSLPFPHPSPKREICTSYQRWMVRLKTGCRHCSPPHHRPCLCRFPHGLLPPTQMNQLPGLQG